MRKKALKIFNKGLKKCSKKIYLLASKKIIQISHACASKNKANAKPTKNKPRAAKSKTKQYQKKDYFKEWTGI